MTRSPRGRRAAPCASRRRPPQSAEQSCSARRASACGQRRPGRGVDVVARPRPCAARRRGRRASVGEAVRVMALIPAAPRRAGTRRTSAAAARGRRPAPAQMQDHAARGGLDADAPARSARRRRCPAGAAAARRRRPAARRPAAARAAAARAKVEVTTRNSLVNTPNGGRPADRHHAEREAPGEHRMADAEPADLGDALGALDLGDMADGEEDRRLGQAVHGHVQQPGEIGERAAHAEGEGDRCPCARSRNRRTAV